MDNLTHTLAGVVSADLALWLFERVRPSRPPSRNFRTLALMTSALASNAPDIDFVYVGITGGKLGYLLHHRGHTHTLLGLLPLSALCVGLAVLIERMLGRRTSLRGAVGLFGFAVFGAFLHLCMDFSNNYGVHPFWPFDNRWFYGDTLFIVEPWLLLALAGGSMGALGRSMRVLIGVAMAALLALGWRGDYMGPGLAGALTVYAFGWLWWAQRAAPAGRLLGTVGVCLSFLGCSLWGRYAARSALAEALAADTELSVAELVSTPAPGNPFCWQVLAVQRSRTQYVVRQGLVASWPALLEARECAWQSEGNTAPLAPSALAVSSPRGYRVVWGPEFRAPIAELVQTLSGDCRAAAFARFARVPFWIRKGDATTLIGDFRYDRSPAVDFAELPLGGEAPCPRFEPPWTPPFDASG